MDSKSPQGSHESHSPQGNIRVDRCRICDSEKLYMYLDLGKLPLANRFVKSPHEDEPRFPLEVLYCEDCGLSQLSLAIDPEVLFSYYPYHSSVAEPFRKHCAAIAAEAQGYFPKGGSGALAVDIASNDGCLPGEFAKKGFDVLGVDPAKNLAEIANRKGIPTICAFWGKDAANEIISRGGADVITATNVFAHVHDVNGFVEQVQRALKDEGIVMFEFHYAWELIKNNAFDTIYHEHHSYFLLRPVKMLFEKHGLRIFDARIFRMHGGALRVYAVKSGNKAVETRLSVQEMLRFEEENGLYNKKTYREFAGKVEKIKKDLLVFLREQKKAGKLVAGFGAAAKGNTLLNYCGVNSSLVRFIVDETQDKQGLYYAGTGIPIVGIGEIAKRKPDFIIIFPWNFEKEIIRNKVGVIKEFKANGGKYVIPIPEVRTISGEGEL